MAQNIVFIPCCVELTARTKSIEDVNFGRHFLDRYLTPGICQTHLQKQTQLLEPR